MKLPCILQPRILKQAIKALFSKPYTTNYPSCSYTPVSTFRGRPRYNSQKCIGCAACAQVCPSKCIEVIDDTKANPPVRRLIHHVDACIWCGQCERYCTTREGIKQTLEYECSGYSPADFEEKVEKELVRCEMCGCIIAPLDQIRYLVGRLGELAYTNPTLMLIAGQELKIIDSSLTPVDNAVTRTRRINILCPKCRRKTALIV